MQGASCRVDKHQHAHKTFTCMKDNSPSTCQCAPLTHTCKAPRALMHTVHRMPHTSSTRTFRGSMHAHVRGFNACARSRVQRTHIRGFNARMFEGSCTHSRILCTRTFDGSTHMQRFNACAFEGSTFNTCTFEGSTFNACTHCLRVHAHIRGFDACMHLMVQHALVFEGSTTPRSYGRM
jgi:hypothetical protein